MWNHKKPFKHAIEFELITCFSFLVSQLAYNSLKSMWDPCTNPNGRTHYKKAQNLKNGQGIGIRP